MARLKSKERPSSSSLRSLLTRSYALDYLGILLLALGNLAIAFMVPFHRMFSLDDRSKAYPHADAERVPVPMLFFYACGLPALVISAYCLVAPSRSSSEKKHLAHVALLGLAISIMLATFFTDVVKNGVGRPRPDLLDRCKPQEDTPEHELVDISVCTTDRNTHLLEDGFRSFPSGHSSFSWSGLGYLALFLAGQLRALRPRADMTRAVIAMVPCVGALLITISRTEDYRHDVFDVTAGSIIGIATAFYAYRRYFPPLASKLCDEAFRKDDEDDDDNEEGDVVEFERLQDDVEMGILRPGRE